MKGEIIMNKIISYLKMSFIIGVDILLIRGLLSLGIGGATLIGCILVSLPVITIIEELLLSKIAELFGDED